jgi:magnesium transporter
MGNVRSRCYQGGVLHAEDFALGEVSDHLGEPDAIVWVDIVDATAEDLAPLAAELGLHELAVEDALEPHQRSKVDWYPSHLFVACHAVRLDGAGAGDRLARTEIDAFVGTRWVVTARTSDHYSIERVLQRWDNGPELLAKGAGVMMYALLDDIVDGYFDVVDQIDGYFERIADTIFAEHPLDRETQRAWYEMRRALSQFHRLVLPLREALNGLVRHQHEIVQPDVLPYWQDLYDHVLVVSETTESLRETASSLVEANLSLRDYRQNLVMKKVSSWAAIVAAPTLVTGYYGMNVPFPGSGETAGVVAASLIMVAVSACLFLLFRAREWL